MAFSLNELIIYSQKGWLGIQGTGNRLTAPDNLTWYEEQATNDVIVKPTQIWSEFDLIPSAATSVVADTNVTANPTILEKRKVRLTASPNNKAFFAYETPGDVTTALKNWVMPQLIPQSNGASSIGYMCRIYNGDPDSGGTEISTTQGQVDALTAWVFNFGAGTLIVSSDFTGVTNPNDVWLTGYRYVGETGGGGGTSTPTAPPETFTECVDYGYHNIGSTVSQPITIEGWATSSVNLDRIEWRENTTLVNTESNPTSGTHYNWIRTTDITTDTLYELTGIDINNNISKVTNFIKFVYPVYATTNIINNIDIQPLASLEESYEVDLIGEDDTNKQIIDFHDSIIPTGILFKSDFGGEWQYFGDSKVASLSFFTSSTTTHLVEGSTLNYSRFTWNGLKIGKRKVKFEFT